MADRKFLEADQSEGELKKAYCPVDGNNVNCPETNGNGERREEYTVTNQLL